MDILVVDDNEAVRRLLRRVIGEAGHDVLEAADGPRAWEMFDRRPVPLVICDWMIPGLDGLELCRKVRARPKSGYTYFILVSGQRLGSDNFRRAMEAGADDFLAKPIDLELLLVRLKVAERILDLNRRMRRLEGFIPVCMYCRRVRRDDDAYEAMEDYIEEHSLAVFSHGVCPECLEKLTKAPGAPGP